MPLHYARHCDLTKLSARTLLPESACRHCVRHLRIVLDRYRGWRKQGFDGTFGCPRCGAWYEFKLRKVNKGYRARTGK